MSQSIFMPIADCMLKLRPPHALVQEELPQQRHVWSYGLQVQVSSMSNLMTEFNILA